MRSARAEYAHRSRRCRRVLGSWTVAAALVVFAGAMATAEQVNVDCRPENPSQSAFLRVSDAIGYLNTRPVLGDWDYVLLHSDCIDNVYIGRSRVWIAPAWDSCPWNGCTTNGEPVRITAADPNAAVITVEGPYDLMLVHILLSGGSNGLAVTGGGSVTGYGLTAERNLGNPTAATGNGFSLDSGSSLNLGEGGALNNEGHGIRAQGGASVSLFGSQSWLQNKPLVIAGNGGGGLRIDRSHVSAWAGVTVENNGGWGMLLLGADVSFGSCCGAQSFVRNNPAGGAFLSEGSETSFWGDTVFRNNGPYGIDLDSGSLAMLITVGGKSVVVEGHTEVGVNVTTHGHVSLNGPHVVRNNGTAMKAWSAGVRIDGGSQAYFGDGATGSPPEITGNTGWGVLVDLGSVLEAPSVLIQGNSREAVRTAHRSTTFLGADAQLAENGGGPLRCDPTSLVITDKVARSLACLVIERPVEPRPVRPDPFAP